MDRIQKRVKTRVVENGSLMKFDEIRKVLVSSEVASSGVTLLKKYNQFSITVN